jgi:hypothetical protein
MGTPMYLLRIAPEQLTLDGDALVSLILAAAHAEESYAADRTVGIDTAWQWLEPLLTGGRTPGTDPSTLPISDGRPVEVASGPPVGVLEPAKVRIAADFLTSADFDDLWAQHRPAVEDQFGTSLPDESRDALRAHLNDLRRFYSAAAASGEAVAKWMAF